MASWALAGRWLQGDVTNHDVRQLTVRERESDGSRPVHEARRLTSREAVADCSEARARPCSEA